MKHKLLIIVIIVIIVVVLVVIGAAAAGTLFYAYPIQTQLFGALTINYFRSWSAPPGTTTTELNAAYEATGAVAPSPPAAVPSPNATTGDWPGYNRTLTSERYSQLSQINTKNAGKLKVLCIYDTKQYTGFEAGLIVMNDALIGTTEHDIFSLDPANCHENWRTSEDYKPATPLGVNRGAAYMNGLLFRGTQDGRVLAYDFKTGKRVWETTIADPKLGETAPAAPIAWNGLVFIGNAGGDNKGVKGRMYALDAKTGKIVWEFYLVPKTDGDLPADRKARRRSTCRHGKTLRAHPSPVAQPGRPTLWIRPRGNCMSPAAIRHPTSRSACARAKISIPAPSSC